MGFTYDRPAVAHTSQHSNPPNSQVSALQRPCRPQIHNRTSNPSSASVKMQHTLSHGMVSASLGWVFRGWGPNQCQPRSRQPNSPRTALFWVVDCAMKLAALCSLTSANGSCLPTPTGGEQDPGADQEGEKPGVLLDQHGTKLKQAKHSRC
jgi:hypothetical protein